LLSGFFLISFIALSIVSTLEFGSAQTYKEVSGIIRSDTTWTKANSPYSITGPVAIANGATLTIAPGVQVFFNKNSYIQVNGTLVARGSSNEHVSFIGDNTNEIIFMPYSKSWNEQTGSGSIIEKWQSNTLKITINGSSPKISSGISQAMITINNGAPLIVNNRLLGESTSIAINGGEPMISSNNLSSYKIYVEGGSPMISGNTIRGFVIRQGYDVVGYTGTCIEASGGNSYISNNNISNCYIAIQIGNGVIQNNTLSAGKPIVVVGSFSPTIKYNNIYGGAPKLALSEGANQDVDATYNWWDTTDEAMISQSIVDNKNNFNLGKVSFVPYLAEPNPQAMPDPYAPIITPDVTVVPTTSSSQYPSATNSQPISGNTVFFGLGLVNFTIVALLGIIVILLVVIVLLHRRR